MAVSKAQRSQVWNKSGGMCWYCGDQLPAKGWHVDHQNPVYRDQDGMQKPQNDTIENMVPACAPCNRFKSVFTVEEFRAEIQQQADRAFKYSVNFRTALRFGTVKTVPGPVVFWFEQHCQEVG